MNKYNNLIINTMETNFTTAVAEMVKNTNYAEMNYGELLGTINEMMATVAVYKPLLEIKRKEELAKAMSSIMGAYCATKEEMMECVDMLDFSKNPMNTFSSIKKMETEVTPEIAENSQDNDEILAIPEFTQTSTTEETTPSDAQNNDTIIPENKVETKTKSVFDNPAFKEKYNPVSTCKETKENVESDIKETVDTMSEEKLPSMEELLCENPEYKAFYYPEETFIKKQRRLATMEELTSGNPVRRVLCMGNTLPKGAAFRQHTRQNNVRGIIPTETATGKTRIYIPS